MARGAKSESADAAFAPSEILWLVRVELESVFEHRKVRRRLRRLERPFIGTGNRHIDLGAWNEADARTVAMRARAVRGVKHTVPTEIRGRLRRWILRQRVGGNYWSDSGAHIYGPWGDGGTGDGGGGGNGGGS